MKPFQVLTTAPTGSPEWHEAHKGRISGSGIADILGVGRNSPYRRWAIITGRVVPEDISHLPHIIAGNRLEPVVADWWESETKRKLAPGPGVLQHPQLDFLIGTPDRLILEGPDNPEGIWEGKTTAGFLASQWADDVPVQHRIQLYAYFAVSGLRWGSFGALAGGSEFLWRDEVCDETWLDWMLGEVSDWWDRHIVSDTPPDTDGSEPTLRTLRQLHPDDNGETIALPGDLLDASMELEQLEEKRKDYDRAIDSLKARVMAALGPNTYGVCGDYKWSWKTQERAEYMVKASKSRVLRRSKVKN